MGGKGAMWSQKRGAGVGYGSQWGMDGAEMALRLEGGLREGDERGGEKTLRHGNGR